MSIIDANAIVDFLASVIADRQRSPEDKERAAAALRFYAVKEDEANAETLKFEAANAEAVQAGQPEFSPETLGHKRRAIIGYGQVGAKMLWYTPSDCVRSSYTGTDSIVYQMVTSKRFGGIRPDEFYEYIPDSGPAPQLGKSRADDVILDATNSALGPVPQFEPAVPLPVLRARSQASDADAPSRDLLVRHTWNA